MKITRVPWRFWPMVALHLASHLPEEEIDATYEEWPRNVAMWGICGKQYRREGRGK